MKMKKSSQFLYALTACFYVSGSVIGIASILGLQRSVDFAAEGDVSGLIFTLSIVLLVIMPLGYLFSVMAIRFRVRFMRDVLIDAKHNRLNVIFSRKEKQPAYEASRDMSFFTTDIETLAKLYLYNRAILPMFIAQFMLALGTMIWINWIVTLVTAVLSLLPMIVSIIFSKSLARSGKAYSDTTAEYVDIIQEYVGGKKEITAYDKQSIFLDKHRIQNTAVENTKMKLSFLTSLSFYTAMNMSIVVQVAMVGVSSYFIINGGMTFGYMMAMFLLMHNLLNPVQQALSAMNEINSAKEIIKKANEEPEPPESNKNEKKDFCDSLTVSNLGICYTDDEYVVQNMNLKFHKGKKYLVCAPSGYGKSSIARAIALDFSVYDGVIAIDGQDIRQIKDVDYHKILRYISQSPQLFSDTVLNNLLFFDNEPAKNELEKVLEITRVKEFVPDEDSLNRRISDKSGLSGGQKQRIVLARALLHKPQILILDEITAGIDLDTAIGILSDIFIDKNLTAIAISHETDKNFQSLFDEVIVL